MRATSWRNDTTTKGASSSAWIARGRPLREQVEMWTAPSCTPLRAVVCQVAGYHVVRTLMVVNWRVLSALSKAGFISNCTSLLYFTTLSKEYWQGFSWGDVHVVLYVSLSGRDSARICDMLQENNFPLTLDIYFFFGYQWSSWSCSNINVCMHTQPASNIRKYKGIEGRYIWSLNKKKRYINFYQFEIFAIKAAEKQRK